MTQKPDVSTAWEPKFQSPQTPKGPELKAVFRVCLMVHGIPGKAGVAFCALNPKALHIGVMHCL